MAHKKAATLEGAAQIESQTQSNGNDANAQRRRILDFLRQHGSLSTIDARHLIDCLHPAARVMELRNAGYSIATVWSHEVTPEGGRHRVARYHLMSEAGTC
ncbi:helix-turn-helix domain-containing protein [Paraburkholderia dioscoreae]|uniref:Winged helix-turn-helix domain-containing protein n=1 Tax=Paraburkholderia dioscoreae TaxID=2604047 RepID=A0A5Q4YW52_9BURK|nr:helix-turn-helix domain-containing protein [Paraburkholderia dioscoreae]VVD29960.1 conserved protein of unknown function [Paraburkholderia dioscoreae]